MTTRAARPLSILFGVLAAVVAAVTAIEPADASHDFDDVGERHPFHQQIGWMAGEGLSSGFSDGTFQPGGPVTRQAMVVFLYNLAGEPGAGLWVP